MLILTRPVKKYLNLKNSLIKKIADIEKGNIPENDFKFILKQLKKAGLSRKELKELEKRYKNARKAKQDKEKKKPTKLTFLDKVRLGI